MNADLRSLPIGQKLGEYEIEGILGQGAFGITYLARDLMLHRKYAIKEYYPREYAVRDSTLTVKAAGSKEDRDTYSWGLSRFLEEARILARFDDPNIIGVRRFFEDNGTAYLVMDYCEGDSLDVIVKAQGPLQRDKLMRLVPPLLSGLSRVHAANFLHRDIKPANIFIRHDGSPVLLDFGAARQEVVSQSKSVTSLATPGYGAVEQYSTHGRQGPWTDIYGLGATLYRVVTGDKPQDSPGRMLNDELVPASIKAKGRYPDKFLQAIDAAMRVFPEKRPQTIDEWRAMFDFTPSGSSKPERLEPAFTAKTTASSSKHSEQTPSNVPDATIQAVDPLLINPVDSPSKIVNKTSGESKKSIYAVVGSVAVIGALVLFASQKGPEKNAVDQTVKPTAVSDQTENSPSTQSQASFSQTHRSPGQSFMFFDRSLQVPRTDTSGPLSEAETRWCIYEGIRIGVIETKGKKNVPSSVELAKFKSACSKRLPDESGKTTIPYELSDQQLNKLKGMKSL